MKQVLSLALSIFLIYGSVTPSLAQIYKYGLQVQKTLRAAQIAPSILKRMTPVTRLALRPFNVSLRYVSLGTQATVQPIAGTMRTQVAQQVQNSVGEKVDLTSVELTPRQAVETIHNFTTIRGTEKSLYVLNGIPLLNVTRGLPIQLSDRIATTETLRTMANHAIERTGSLSDNLWGRDMAIITNLGIYGTAEDAALIVSLVKNIPAKFNVYTDVIASRALISLNAPEALQELINLRTANGKLPSHWKGVAEYVRINGLPVEMPEVAKGNVRKFTSQEKESLEKWNSLNLYHENFSADAIANWVSLREGASTNIVADEAVEGVVETTTRPTLQNSLNIETTSPADLTLGATELPSSSTAEVTSVGVENVEVAQTPVAVKKPSKLSNLFSRFTAPFRISSANSTARKVLSQQYPLPTLLKQIVESPAKDMWREQALVRLYEQGALKEIIADLPIEARNKMDALYKDNDLETLGKRLLSLYEMGVISDGVSKITNAKKQASLLEELDQMVAREDWTARARAAYDSTPVLHTNFSGVVPPVPTVDKEEILRTFRPANWANTSRGESVEKNGMLYFKNGIPFYYRNSKGQLSSAPVGILSQEPANMYGRFLSSIGLAGKPGMMIPKGFVLALDEMGQWKFIMPNGNRAIVEANPKSKKLLEEIQQNGSKQVEVNTPYSTSDLLAMANLLEHNPDLNLELVLNAPDSMKPFLKILGSYIGLDSAGALTGPFKATLKGLEGLSNMLGNLVGGVGYMSPWAGGAASGLMTKLGSIRTLKILLGASIAGLGYSFLPEAWGGLGMTGFQSMEALKSIPLLLMSLPLAIAVLVASLLGTQMNVFLNFFKDPKARTAAHLAFAETKQWSRLGLVVSTAILGALLGVNWSIVVPAALGMSVLSAALLYNTPVYREFKEALQQSKTAALQEQERLASLTPQQRAQELAMHQSEVARKKELSQKFSKLYKDLFRSKTEVKDISFRVKMVYASYAASLMMLGQTSTELFGSTAGQFLVGGFMFSTAMMRRFASKQVSTDKMTDNQLTGMSLPLLAASGLGLAAIPYTGIAGLVALGGLGILHYVATAVPGQLDAARLQNLVSAELSKRKQSVLDFETMTPAQQAEAKANWDEMDQLVFAEPTKEKRLALLGDIEKSWAGKASRDYSYFNGHGLAGIAIAAGAAYLFADLGPQWAKGFLDHIGSFMGDGSTLQTLNRLVLGYAAGVAGVLAWKNWNLTKDFFSLFGKKKITAETISSGQITPKDFGMTMETKDRQLVKVRKDLSSLENQLLNYGVNSERKLTKHLQMLIRTHNRFAAALALEREAGATEMSSALKADFTHLQSVLQQYQVLLKNSDPSIMLQREFNILAQALCEDGIGLTTLRTDIAYMPEGTYKLPAGYAMYEDASQLVAELDQLAGQIMHGTVGVDTYRQFISYQTRVNDLFTEYKKLNPADSARVLKQQEKLNKIIKGLKRADNISGILEHNAGATSPQDIQELRDVLSGYAD